MLGLAHFDLGKSLWTGEPVRRGDRAPRSRCRCRSRSWRRLIAVLIAIPLGTISAVYRDTWIDYIVRVIAVSGLAIPSLLARHADHPGAAGVFNWLPKIGYVSIFEDPITNLPALIWPALSVGYRYAAVATRMMRSALLEVMREDYIRTARAKGVYQPHRDAPACAAQRHAAGRHRHRPRVRVPDRRSRRHRAGVQHQRHRQAVRRRDHARRLQADPGPRAADRRQSSSSSIWWSTCSTPGSIRASA